MARPKPADREPDEDRGGDGPQDPGRKPFAAWLQEQRDGGLHGELTDALAEVVGRVMDLNKAGSLTLTLNIGPAGKNQSAVFITDVVKSKPPEDRQAALFFADSKGNLSRSNPNQGELPLRDVSEPQPPTNLR